MMLCYRVVFIVVFIIDNHIRMSTISDEQLATLQTLFKKYDINNDGRIDKEELVIALKELKVHSSADIRPMC